MAGRTSTGRSPGAGGGRRPELRPGEATGTPPGPNRGSNRPHLVSGSHSSSRTLAWIGSYLKMASTGMKEEATFHSHFNLPPATPRIKDTREPRRLAGDPSVSKKNEALGFNAGGLHIYDEEIGGEGRREEGGGGGGPGLVGADAGVPGRCIPSAHFGGSVEGGDAGAPRVAERHPRPFPFDLEPAFDAGRPDAAAASTRCFDSARGPRPLRASLRSRCRPHFLYSSSLAVAHGEEDEVLDCEEALATQTRIHREPVRRRAREG